MKKIAPIIITALVVTYLGFYAYVLFFVIQDDMGWGKIFFGIIGLIVLGIIGAMLYTLKERFTEMDKEDKDDLSKY